VVEKVKIKVERVKGKLQQAVDQMKAAVAAKRDSRWAKWWDWVAKSLPSSSTQGLVDGNHTPGCGLGRGITLPPDYAFGVKLPRGF
jgi:hypothetical protein